ncbi:hypothetical protein MHBO_004117, partial [Bonamia ostreae]
KALSDEQKKRAKELKKEIEKEARANWNKRDRDSQQRIADISALESKTSPTTQFMAGLVSAFGGDVSTKKTQEFIQSRPDLESYFPETQDNIASAKTQAPGTYMAGRVGGELAQYAGAAKALGAIPKVGAALKSGSAAKRIGAASAVALPVDIAQAGLRAETPKEFAQELALNVGLGVAGGAAVEGVGAGVRALRGAGVRLPRARRPVAEAVPETPTVSPENRTVREYVSEARGILKRKFVDAGDTVNKIAKITKDK